MSDTYIYSIGVIGSGVMGEALVSAILKSGIANSMLAISDKRVERTTELAAKYGCSVTSPEEIAGKA